MKTAMFTTVFTMYYHCKRKYIYLLIYVKTIPEMNYKQLLLSDVCGKGERMAGIQGLQKEVYHRHFLAS